MNSGGSSSGKAPKDPQPQGNVAPYGQTSDFSPSWVSFLPDIMGADDRLPMATGLKEEHLAAIRDRAPPPELSAKPKDAGLINRDTFAQMMAEYEKEKKLNDMKAAFIGGINPGLRRGGSGNGGGYTTSGRGGGGGWSGKDHSNTGSGGLY